MTIKAVVYEAEEGGFWAKVPSMPGCSTQGETMEELVANLQEVIELWMEVDQERKLPSQSEEPGGRELDLRYTAMAVA